MPTRQKPPKRSLSLYAAVALLGLPKFPWQYTVFRMDEREILATLGLVKAYPVTDSGEEGINLEDYLVFPSSSGREADQNARTCSLSDWEDRQSIAYFLNLHRLCHGQWVEKSRIQEALTRIMQVSWSPGTLITQSSNFTKITTGTAYIPLNELCVFPLDGSPMRKLNSGDMQTDTSGDEIFIWELYAEGVNGIKYLHGQELWHNRYKEYSLNPWIKLSQDKLVSCRLTLVDIWKRDNPTPDKAKVQRGPNNAPLRPELTPEDKKLFGDLLMETIGISSEQRTDSTENAVKRILQFHSDSASRGFYRKLTRWETARNKIEAEMDLSGQKGWLPNETSVKSLLDLREVELEIWDCFGDLQWEWTNILAEHIDIADAISQNPTRSRHSLLARQVLLPEAIIRKFEAKLLKQQQEQKIVLSSSSNSDGEYVTFPAMSLEEVRVWLGCIGDLIPGMVPGAPGLKWHQLEAIRWLFSRLEHSDSLGLLLADAPGLGKTLIILGLLMRIRNWSISEAAYSMLLGVKSLSELSGPVIIVCSPSIQTQWMREAKRWVPSAAWEFLLYPRNQQERESWWRNGFEKSKADMPCRVIVITYNAVVSDYKESKNTDPKPTIFDLCPWLLVVDEAHIARNERTKVFKALNAISSLARARILLTATPIHNQIENMLAMMALMQMQLTEEENKLLKHIKQVLPQFRKRAYQFLVSNVQDPSALQDLERHQVMTDDSSMITKAGYGLDFLQRIISVLQYLLQGHYLRRTHNSQDWKGDPLLVMPRKEIHRRPVCLTADDRTAYDEAKGTEGSHMKGLNSQNFLCDLRRRTIHRGGHLVTTSRMAEWMKQENPSSLEVKDAYRIMLDANASYQVKADISPSAKLNEVIRILDQIAKEDCDKAEEDRRKILIYCIWVSLWPVLQALLRQSGFYVLLINEEAGPKRDEQVMQFQEPGPHLVDNCKSWVALISSAVATGVNLTRGSVLVMLDYPWSHQETEQLIGRIFRCGQLREVEVYQIVAQDTVDELLLQVSEQKGALMEMLSEESIQEEFSMPDLSELSAQVIPPSPQKKSHGIQYTPTESIVFEQQRLELVGLVKKFFVRRNEELSLFKERAKILERESLDTPQKHTSTLAGNHPSSDYTASNDPEMGTTMAYTQAPGKHSSASDPSEDETFISTSVKTHRIGRSSIPSNIHTPDSNADDLSPDNLDGDQAERLPLHAKEMEYSMSMEESVEVGDAWSTIHQENTATYSSEDIFALETNEAREIPVLATEIEGSMNMESLVDARIGSSSPLDDIQMGNEFSAEPMVKSSTYTPTLDPEQPESLVVRNKELNPDQNISTPEEQHQSEESSDTSDEDMDITAPRGKTIVKRSFQVFAHHPPSRTDIPTKSDSNLEDSSDTSDEDMDITAPRGKTIGRRAFQAFAQHCPSGTSILTEGDSNESTHKSDEDFKITQNKERTTLQRQREHRNRSQCSLPVLTINQSSVPASEAMQSRFLKPAIGLKEGRKGKKEPTPHSQVRKEAIAAKLPSLKISDLQDMSTVEESAQMRNHMLDQMFN